jgi:hypothetical protein
MNAPDSLIHQTSHKIFPHDINSDVSEPFEVFENAGFIISSGLVAGENFMVQAKVGAPCDEEWVDMCPWSLTRKGTNLLITIPGWYRLKFESKNLHPNMLPVLNVNAKAFFKRVALNAALAGPSCGCC